MTETPIEKDIIETCDICGEYQGSPAQIRGHRPRCKGKEPIIIEEPILRERPKPERKNRVPFGSPKLSMDPPSDDGFVYRRFNDNWSHEPGRLRRAMNAGYEIAEDYPRSVVGTNKDGSEIIGVVMRIPKELYEEDQNLKQKAVDRVDESILQGTFEAKAGDNRYIPDGIKIWSSNNENR